MRKSSPSASSSRLIVWWLPITVSLVVFVGTLMVLIPQVNTFLDNRTELEETEEQLVKAQAKVTQVKQIDISNLDYLESLVATALPEHKPYFEFMVTLQQLASETGIFLQDFKLDPGSLASDSAQKTPSTVASSTKLSTKLAISGTTTGVSQFVEQLHQAMPLVTVTSISISQKMVGDQLDQRVADLGLDLYYAAPLTKSGKISFEPLPQFTESQQAIFTVLADYSVKVDATGSASSFVNADRTDIFTF